MTYSSKLESKRVVMRSSNGAKNDYVRIHNNIEFRGVFLIANKSTKDIKIILFTSNKKHLKVHSHNASAYTIYVKEHKVPNSNGESSKEGN